MIVNMKVIRRSESPIPRYIVFAMSVIEYNGNIGFSMRLRKRSDDHEGTSVPGITLS